MSHHEHGDGVVVTNHRAIVDHRAQSLKIEALTVKHGDGAGVSIKLKLENNVCMREYDF